MPKPTAVLKVLHTAEPEYADELKKEIWESLGDIDHIYVDGQEVLVAAYIQSPYFGRGSLLKGDEQQNEDKWQSKCFMVVKIGDGVEAACKKAGRRVPAIGQWNYGFPADHRQISIRGIGSVVRKDTKEITRNVRPWGDAGWPCRFVAIGDIYGWTPRPQDVV